MANVINVRLQDLKGNIRKAQARARRIRSGWTAVWRLMEIAVKQDSVFSRDTLDYKHRAGAAACPSY